MGGEFEGSGKGVENIGLEVCSCKLTSRCKLSLVKNVT